MIYEKNERLTEARNTVSADNKMRTKLATSGLAEMKLVSIRNKHKNVDRQFDNRMLSKSNTFCSLSNYKSTFNVSTS